MTVQNDSAYHQALGELIRRSEGLQDTAVIVSVDYDAGGEYQIGDYTWDYDNASLTVRYRNLDNVAAGVQSFYIDLEYYEGPNGTSGFAGLMEELLTGEDA